MVKHQLSAQLNNIITILIWGLAFAVPIFFLRYTTEFIETPKFLLLFFGVLALLILTAVNWVLSGKVTFTRTPLDVPLLLIVVVLALSAFFSPLRFTSIVGNFPRIHGGAASWILYILFFFLITINLRTRAQIKGLFYALLASTVVVSLVSVLSYFKLYLPFSFTNFASFTPTGSSFVTAVLATLLLPFPMLSVIRTNKILPLPVALAISTLLGLTIVLVGNTVNFIIAAFVVGLTLFAEKSSLNPSTRAATEIGRRSFNTGMLILILIAICTLVLGASFVPKFGPKQNPLNTLRADFPKEVQLPFSTSWTVSATAFRDKPFLGTGPATYLYDFTSYKPLAYNGNEQLWNVRFDTAFNEYLQILATTGGLGLLAFLFLSAVVISYAVKGIMDKENLLTVGLSIGALGAIVALALHSSTLVMAVAVLVILALLMAVHKLNNNQLSKVEELTIGIKASKLTDSNLVTGDILPLILCIPVLLVTIYLLWSAIPMIRADRLHRTALDAANTRAVDTYTQLVQAVNTNPNVDLYRTDLAQTAFALANGIARTKGPTEASPTGSLTDQDKTQIQELLSLAIQQGQAAVALNPLSSQNWEILGSIYRQITGVAQNAVTFALDAYGRAIQQDPYNPLLRLNAGGIYYSIKNYDLAIRFFDDAVRLKPDYANAYYNLSVALRDKGALQEAVATAEKVVGLLGPDSADYKAASDYLADLKSRVATGSAQEAQTVPPAAQTNSALQNQNLPDVKVKELNNPPRVATPSAAPKP